MSRLVAVFSPQTERRQSWTLSIDANSTLSIVAGGSTGPFEVGSPDMNELTTRMFEAQSACMVRTRADGAIEISATDRGAEALREWLASIIARGVLAE